MLDLPSLMAMPRAVRARREMAPMVHAVLERADRLHTLTDEERAFARRAYFSTMARVPFFREGLAAFLDDARAEGARPLLLKGAALAFGGVYADPATRPMADLDVAVAPHELAALGARLIARGYQLHGAGRARFALSHSHHAAWVHERAPTVELHVRLMHELDIDGAMDGWQERAQLLPSTIGPLPAPAWTDLLYHVLVHGAAHAFGDSPMWVVDAALLCARGPSVTEGLAAIARQRRAVAALHVAVQHARRVLPSLPLPEAPAPSLAGVRARVLRLALGDEPLGAIPSPRASLLARLALTDGAGGIVRAVADKIVLRAIERFVERTSERG